MGKYTRTYDFDDLTRAKGSEIRAELDAIATYADEMPSPEQLASGSPSFAVAAGTANAITIEAPGTWTTYTGKGSFRLSIKITASNTGPVTLNVDGLGDTACSRTDNSPLAEGDLISDVTYDFVYSEERGKFYVSAFGSIVSIAQAYATSAGSSATTATTQAGIATAAASTATTQAGIATTQASTATTQAGIATTKAGEASDTADAIAILLAEIGPGLEYTRITSGVTATDKQGFIAATAGGAFTITLPATPAEGDVVAIADGGSVSTNAVTVARNGSTINGAASNYTFNSAGGHLLLVFDSITWRTFLSVSAYESISGKPFNTASESDEALSTKLFLTGIFSDKKYALGSTGTAKTITVTDGGVFTATLTGNCTFTLSGANLVANRVSSFSLILTNDATPSRSVAFAGGTFRYPGGSVSRSTAANRVDLWFFVTPDGGTTWYVTIPMIHLS